jgi:tetratricopeptide (TPR) repeat protein
VRDNHRRLHEVRRPLQPLAAGMIVLALALSGGRAAAQTAPSDKSTARKCFDQAQAAYLTGHLDEARRGFECAYAQWPSPELAWNLARVCERTGDVESGVRYFRAYLSQAQMSARERKRVEGRIQALLDLAARQSAPIALKPGTDVQAASDARARVFFERGVKLYQKDQFGAAATAFVAALKMSNAPELHYNLAVVSERQGRIEDACDHYRAYLDAQPGAADQADVLARIDRLRAREDD